MGAWGALIMGFFGAMFAALTLSWRWHLAGSFLAAPFLVFAIIAALAILVIRLPGTGLRAGPHAGKAILWSTSAEGVGLFLAANIVINLHRPEWLLPVMALIVGLHFLPIAWGAPFRPFYVLGGALILAALIGFLTGEGAIAGLAAALSLWIAAGVALVRDWRAKASAPSRSPGRRW